MTRAAFDDKCDGCRVRVGYWRELALLERRTPYGRRTIRRPTGNRYCDACAAKMRENVDLDQLTLW